MNRRFLFGPRPPKGPPPGSVVPTSLNEAGQVICPRCRNMVGTPTAWNPWTGQEEAMILLGGRTARCPHCKVVHFISAALAREFNRRLYPTDPQFAPEEEN